MRLFFQLVILILFYGNAFSVSQAQELRFFRIGTSGIAGTYYPIGGMIAQAVSNPPGSRPCDQGGSCGPPGLIVIAQSANGSLSNVKGIQQGNIESGFVQSDVAYWAYSGSGIFKGKAPVLELRSIANLYPETIQIVVRKDSGINQISDLVGKRVSLDEPGSGTLIDAELLLKQYGISTDDFQAKYMKPDIAIGRMRDNKLDAFFIVSGYPSKSITELAGSTAITLLPVDGSGADKLVSSFGFFTHDKIPQGTYGGIAAVDTVSVEAQWLVAASVDSELVYQITKTLWNKNSRKLLDSGHAKGKQIRLETALHGIVVPLHPGAKRFYDEIGMSVQ